MKKTKQYPLLSTVAAALVALLIQFAAPSAFAVTNYWDNNGATAGFGTAAGTWADPTIGDGTQGWSTDATGGTVPVNVTTTTNDVLLFGFGTNALAAGTINVSGTVEANLLNFGGPSGAIILTNGTSLTLGGVSPVITTTNTGNVIWTPIFLAPSNSTASISFSRRASLAGTLTLNGVISGSGGLKFTTPNVNSGGVLQTVLLGSANNYTGDTEITTGNVNIYTTVKAGVDNTLPTNTVLTLDGGNGTGTGRVVSYDLNGRNQTLAGLDNHKTRTLRFQRIYNTSATPGILTINNTNDYTFSGNLGSTTANGRFGLIKSGPGTFTLTAANAYTNTTVINAGNLRFQVGGNCANSTVILNATTATNGVSITDNTLSWTSGGLTAAAAGVLEFDFGSVAPSASVSPLNITGAADFSAATPKMHVVTTGIFPGSYPLMTWGSLSGTAPTTADLTVSVPAPLTAASLSVVGNTLYLDITSTGGTVVKANNTTNLNLGTSWVGGVAPNLTKTAKWDSTVTSANSTVLGADVTWAGIEIVDPAGLVTINATNTLTLGGLATNINLTAATVDLTLNCGVDLGFDSTWGVQSGRTLTVAGAVSGTNALTTAEAGTVVLSSSANSYSGNTTVGTTSTLKLGVANVIPNGDDKGIVAVDGTLDLNAFSETLNGLSGAGTVDTVAGGTPTLTVGSTNDSATFTGIIQNTAGTLSLVKTDTGRQDLAGANTLAGTVLVNEGWLTVGESNAPLANVSSITVADGATFGAYGNQVTLDTPITLGAGNPTINITACILPLSGSANTAQRPFFLNGGISGSGNVVFKGMNPINFTGAINVSNCTYTGSSLMTCDVIPGSTLTNNNNIVVGLLGNDALPTTTVLTMDGDIGVGGGRFCDLFLNGYNQTLAGLTNVPRNLRNQRILNRDSAAAATFTLNNSADYTFSGYLGASTGGSLSGNPGNNFNLVKSGSGTLIISREAGNTYANGTTVNGGTLLVNNLTGSGTGTGDVTVNSGGTLGGTGSIAGNVAVNAGGALAPGASIGTLTVNGFLTLDALSTNTFEVNGSTPTNDAVVLGSTVTYGGVLNIVPTGSITNGQTFTLFSGAGATDPSNFASIASSSGAYTFTNGVLTVVTAPVTGPSGPATLTNSFSLGTLALSWPAAQGWRLEQQTNALSKGLSTNWVDITPGSASSTNITVDNTKPTVFYRLAYP